MEAKEGYTIRNCDHCKKPYHADNRNLKRGWGLCCSKRCAAKKREKNKPGYNPVTVAINNERRENWNNNYDDGRGYGHTRDEWNVADDMEAYYERNRRNGWPMGVDEGPEGWDGHKD